MTSGMISQLFINQVIYCILADTLGDLFFNELTHSNDLLKELFQHFDANDIGKLSKFDCYNFELGRLSMINKFIFRVIQDCELIANIGIFNLANSRFNETTFYSWKGQFRE